MILSYLNLNYEVIKKANNSRHGDGNDIKLVKLGPIVLFSNYKLKMSPGRSSQDISHEHIVPLLFKLLISAKYTDDLSIAVDLERKWRQRELTKNKNVKGK